MTAELWDASQRRKEVSCHPPAPAKIKAMRKACKLSQTAAGALVYSALRTWQQWEAGDREMHPGLWELFLIKSGQLKA